MSYSSYSLVQGALFFQLFVWFNLYHYKPELPRIIKTLYYLSGGLLIPILHLTQYSIGYFTTIILMQYVAFILASTAIYETKFNFNEAVSLAFLTVFLNSFWWELFYHVYEFQLWFPTSLTLGWWIARGIQWIRVVPFFFLRRNFEFRKLWVIQAGLLVSYLLTRARFVWRVPIWIHPIHRAVCLATLLYVVMNSKRKVNIIEQG